jgi:hypothetical protein
MIEERPNDPCASVCLCEKWSGCVWGRGEKRVAMKWLGWDERRPLPLYLSPGWGIRGRDERISGRMRGLVGD